MRLHVSVGSLQRNLANPRFLTSRSPNETSPALSRLRPLDSPVAATCGARADLAVPAHAVAAGRLQLPPPADLLGLRRRGDCAVRPVGRRLDDAGAAVALPAMGHIGHRQRTYD